MLFFLYPFHSSDIFSFPFNIPQDSSTLLKNPKPAPNKQTRKIFLISFFIDLNLQTLVLHSKLNSPVALLLVIPLDFPLTSQ